jgi:centromeric protein E
VGHTGAEGVRLKEGGHINKSLLTLGTVIAKLSDSKVDRCEPFLIGKEVLNPFTYLRSKR